MATFDTLRTLLEQGSDVVLTGGLPHDKIILLAEAAQRSGAKLTVSASTASDFLINLSRRFGKTVAFVNGIDDLKKN
ncbi:hypothetical protein [Burkholderia gladioli]|uniref:hypothetical protein n=1 Tax=Burkholderia gladioli TaxID=28095 RepID=UPI001641E9CF|nr:hypothetical protein [Burkholderia gladioli]